jgi:hypothetical protein
LWYVSWQTAQFIRGSLSMRVPSRQIIHNLVNNLISAGSLVDMKWKQKHWVLNEQFTDIGTRFQHTPIKSLKSLFQVTGMLKSSAKRIMQLLKLTPYKITVIFALLTHSPESRARFCNWSVIRGESEVKCIHPLVCDKSLEN